MHRQYDSELYEPLDSRSKVPLHVKWFTDNGLKVKKVDCGKNYLVIKTEDEKGNVGYYGMSNNCSKDSKRELFGKAFTPVFCFMDCEIIVKIDIDASHVADFACQTKSTLFLMNTLEDKVVKEAHMKDLNFLWYDAEGKFVQFNPTNSEKEIAEPELALATYHKISDLDKFSLPDLKMLMNEAKHAD